MTKDLFATNCESRKDVGCLSVPPRPLASKYWGQHDTPNLPPIHPTGTWDASSHLPWWRVVMPGLTNSHHLHYHQQHHKLASPCLSVCRSFSSRVCVFDLLSVTLCVCLPFCLFVCHSVWFCLCLFFCIPVIVALLVCLSFCQKFEHFCLLVSDCVCLFAVLPDYLPASLPSITFTPYCLGNELWGYDEDVCMYVYTWEEKVRDSSILRIHLSSSSAWGYTLWSRR